MCIDFPVNLCNSFSHESYRFRNQLVKSHTQTRSLLEINLPKSYTSAAGSLGLGIIMLVRRLLPVAAQENDCQGFSIKELTTNAVSSSLPLN